MSSCSRFHLAPTLHQFKAVRFCFHQRPVSLAMDCQASSVSFHKVKILTQTSGLHARQSPASRHAHGHTCTHIWAPAHAHTYTYTGTHTLAYADARRLVYMHTHVHACTGSCAGTCIYIQASGQRNTYLCMLPSWRIRFCLLRDALHYFQNWLTKF